MSAQASFARKNHQKPARSDGRKRGISAGEVKDVEELATPRTPVIYEVVRRLGEEEMARPFTSLWWSGVRCRTFDQFLAVGAGHSANASA